jgi:plasmid replication initiation protein
LIRYHRLIFHSIADGALRSTYLPWIESITHVKTGEEEELELRLNSNYEKIWRMLKQRLDEPSVRLKSQYSSRLYQWTKPYAVVGYKRVSLATLRKVLGLEEIKDNSGRVVQEARLKIWENVKQRALDVALKEINKQSDIQLELEFTGRGAYRKVLSLGYRGRRQFTRRRVGDHNTLLHFGGTNEILGGRAECSEFTSECRRNHHESCDDYAKEIAWLFME